MSDCIFCKIIQGEIPCNKVKETETVLAFHDINGKAPTHILIIPKNHHRGIEVMSDKNEIGELFTVGNEIANELGLETGYRFVVNSGLDGGQSVFHTHVHLMGGRQMTWPPG